MLQDTNLFCVCFSNKHSGKNNLTPFPVNLQAEIIMARGAEGKLRRRNRKKEEAANEKRMFADGAVEGEGEGNEHDFGIPLPPGMAAGVGDDDDDSSDDDDDGVAKKKSTLKAATGGGDEPLIIKKKKKKMNSCCDRDDDRQAMSKKKQGIKTTPLVLLLLMVGTAVLPALLYAGDFIGGYLQKNHVLGQLGFRLGMGAVPRKRVMSFYEKHDPSKLEEVPSILAKYYGDYPKLIKRLERKYQDYGYFLEWENDEAPLALAIEQLQETYSTWIHSYWNVYAPQPLKTAARNARYNLATVKKKLRKVWKKQVWPLLEPFLGVPKGAEKQKRQDAADARKRKQAAGGSSAGTRRRSSGFREADDEEM